MKTPIGHAVFRFVVSVDEGVRLLPNDELADVLGSPNREDLFVGAAVAPADAAVILYRGNLEPLVVPLRGLRRTDFTGLTAKEIARIERGEIKKPHQRTLAVLAKRLGVPADRISGY